MTKRITQAAILLDDRIYVGRRHSYIQMENHELPLLKKGIQGFVTEDGSFLTRDEAREIAKATGQIASDFCKVLTSEDLW